MREEGWGPNILRSFNKAQKESAKAMNDGVDPRCEEGQIPG